MRSCSLKPGAGAAAVPTAAAAAAGWPAEIFTGLCAFHRAVTALDSFRRQRQRAASPLWGYACGGRRAVGALRMCGGDGRRAVTAPRSSAWRDRRAVAALWSPEP